MTVAYLILWGIRTLSNTSVHNPECISIGLSVFFARLTNVTDRQTQSVTVGRMAMRPKIIGLRSTKLLHIFGNRCQTYSNYTKRIALN